MRSFQYTFLFLVLTLSSCSSNKKVPEMMEGARFPANFQTCFQMMNSVVNYQHLSDGDDTLLTNAKKLSELESSYGKESLIDLQLRLDDKSIKAANTHVQSLLKGPLEATKVNGKTHYVTMEEAQTILDSIENSKVNRDHYCYDPDNTTGFCFGRAIIGHMEALARNVHPEAIKKIWIAGDMKQWGHHVAPMVKGEEGWLVLDTNIGKPVSTEEWQKFYRPFKAPKAKEVMVFVTQAGRFGPYDSEAYSAVNLFNTNGQVFVRENDFYRGYFHDYFEALDKDKTIKKFPAR